MFRSPSPFPDNAWFTLVTNVWDTCLIPPWLNRSPDWVKQRLRDWKRGPSTKPQACPVHLLRYLDWRPSWGHREIPFWASFGHLAWVVCPRSQGSVQAMGPEHLLYIYIALFKMTCPFEIVHIYIYTYGLSLYIYIGNLLVSNAINLTDFLGYDNRKHPSFFHLLQIRNATSQISRPCVQIMERVVVATDFVSLIASAIAMPGGSSTWTAKWYVFNKLPIRALQQINKLFQIDWIWKQLSSRNVTTVACCEHIPCPQKWSHRRPLQTYVPKEVV